MNKRALFASLAWLLFMAVLCLRARADELQVPCGSLADLKNAKEFRPLSHDEWNAVRVIFHLAPDTPDSFPPGDRALLQMHGDGSASVVFVDGGEVCAPIRLQPAALEMLKQIRDGFIAHVAGRM